MAQPFPLTAPPFMTKHIFGNVVTSLLFLIVSKIEVLIMFIQPIQSKYCYEIT